MESSQAMNLDAQRDTPAPVLYGYYRSSAAYRVRIALALKGLDAQQSFVHLRNGEQTLPPYRSMNPAGLVPLWQHGEFRVAQSLAIIEYLDELYPHPPLLPADPRRRAIAREIALTIACDVHPIGNLRVLKRLEQLGIDESSRAAWSQTWIILGFDAIEARLAGTNGPFALGLAPGLADIFIVPQVYNAKRFGVNLAPYRRIREIDVAASRLTAFAQSEPRSQPDAE